MWSRGYRSVELRSAGLVGFEHDAEESCHASDGPFYDLEAGGLMNRRPGVGEDTKDRGYVLWDLRGKLDDGEE